jgi:hypothetical protein
MLAGAAENKGPPDVFDVLLDLFFRFGNTCQRRDRILLCLTDLENRSRLHEILKGILPECYAQLEDAPVLLLLIWRAKYTGLTQEMAQHFILECEMLREKFSYEQLVVETMSIQSREIFTWGMIKVMNDWGVDSV